MIKLILGNLDVLKVCPLKSLLFIYTTEVTNNDDITWEESMAIKHLSRAVAKEGNYTQVNDQAYYSLRCNNEMILELIKEV